jgi:hypothetical protein
MNSNLEKWFMGDIVRLPTMPTRMYMMISRMKCREN